MAAPDYGVANLGDSLRASPKPRGEFQSKRLSPFSARMRGDDVAADVFGRAGAAETSPRCRSGSPHRRTELSAGMHSGEGMRAALRRTTSAADLRDAAAESMRGCSPRRATPFSARMHGGEGAVQALGFCPESRRGESMPPKLYAREKARPSEDAESDRSWLSPLPRSPLGISGRPPPPVASPSPRSSPRCSPFRGTRPGASPGRPGTPAPARSPLARHVTAPPRDARRGGCGASPCSDGSGVPSIAAIGERATEVSPRQRLRGEGVAVGLRGRGSSGIPWRHLPAYSAAGTMQHTGDRFGALRLGSPRLVPGSVESPLAGASPHRAAGAPTNGHEQVDDTHPRRTAEFSGKLGASTGMRELLEVDRPPPTRMVSSPLLSSPGSSPMVAWVATAQRRQEGIEEAPEAAEEADRHWAPGVHKKGVATTFDTKQSCPYLREDAEEAGRALVPATPHVRTSLAPPSALGPGPQRATVEDPHAHVADLRPELTRNWPHLQEMEAVRVSAINIAARERALLRRFSGGSLAIPATLKAAPVPRPLAHVLSAAPVLLGGSERAPKPKVVLVPSQGDTGASLRFGAAAPVETVVLAPRQAA